MLDKRYQVFVSSTYEDLREERAEVMRALLELDCIPSGMELFPASDDDSWTLIKRVIDECDYYIVIIAGRYGSTNDEGISYTELEYRYALLKGKPMMGFIHGAPGEIIRAKSEETQEGREKLESFIEFVKQKQVKNWTTPEGLGGVVSRGIASLKKTKPAVGWVRADTVPDLKASQEILKLQKENEKLRKLMRQGPLGSEELSQGDDVFPLRYDYTVREYTHPEDMYPDLEEGSGIYEISWNEIISNVGPSILNFIERKAIKKFLEDHVLKLVQSEIMTSASFQGDIIHFDISSQDFQTIIIQLSALGVIEKYSRDDRWKLTEHGEHLVVNLRAIRKGHKKSKTS